MEIITRILAGKTKPVVLAWQTGGQYSKDQRLALPYNPAMGAAESHRAAAMALLRQLGVRGAEIQQTRAHRDFRWFDASPRNKAI